MMVVLPAIRIVFHPVAKAFLGSQDALGQRVVAEGTGYVTSEQARGPRRR